MEHAIIMKSDLNKFYELAESYGLETEEKKIFFIDIKYIIPNTFDFRVWARNWQFATDVLNNGDSFFEMYVCVVESSDQISMLTTEQQLLLLSSSVKLIS